MKNILTVPSALLLVCVVLSSTSLAQPLANVINPITGQPTVPPPPRDPFVPRTPAADVQAMQMNELRVALQELGALVQLARRDSNPLAQELQTAVQNLTRAMEGAFAARPATQPPTPGTNASRNPLATEVEKAYIDLARQYFYLYIGTSDKVVTPPVMAGSNPIAISQVPREITEIVEENGILFERSRLVVEEVAVAVEEEVVEEKGKSEKEEILDNFVECIKKISPAAQITLISELIRTSHMNEELKLLEGLLDDVLNPPAVNRMPNPGRPNQPPGPAQPDVPRRPGGAGQFTPRPSQALPAQTFPAEPLMPLQPVAPPLNPVRE